MAAKVDVANISTDSWSERSLASNGSAPTRLGCHAPVVFIETLLAVAGPVFGAALRKF